MADLQTLTGRNRRRWFYGLPLVVLLGAMAGTVRPAAGQVGPELSGPPPFSNPQAMPPGGLQAPSPAGQIPPPPGAYPAGPPPQETVVDVRIAGNRAVPLNKILPYIQTRIGRPYDSERIQEDVRRLHHTGLFVEVKPYSQSVPGGRIVVFNLVERPLLTDVLFIGCQEKRKDRLQKELKLKAGDPADPMAIEEARRHLEEYYRQDGFARARVTLLEGDRPEDRRAIFYINEGPKQRVSSVNFVGNTIVGDGRLQTQIRLKHPFLYLFGGEFDRKQLEEDVQLLTAYYRSLGYFRARIGHALPEFNEKGNWVKLTFIIDEGPRYKVRNVSVVGATKYTTGALLSELKLKNGEYFNQAKMTADRNTLVDKYGGIGYVFADIQPSQRLMEDEPQLDLVYNITEGDRYRVGKINVVIKGDYPHTQLTTVLNRLSLKPGDIVDIREIRASERRLKASQLFEVNPANGAVPKIVFSPPGQGKPDDEEVADRPTTRSGRGGGRGMGSGSDRGDGTSRFRGQSPDGPADGERVLEITYAVPMEDPRARGPAFEPSAATPDSRPSQWARPEVADDSLSQATRNFSNALVQGKVDRSRTVLTQYSPAARPPLQWSAGATGSDPTYAPAQPQAAAPADGQAFANPAAPAQPVPVQPYANPAAPAQPSTPPTQPTQVQPSPAVGQQWPGPQRPVDSPQGQYIPGPIFDPGSPFNNGSPDGGEPARLLPLDIYAQEAMTGRVMVGVGINSEAGLVGSVVLDEQNFNWTRWPTSWEEIRNGTFFRGRGQRFRLEAAPSIATTAGTQPLQRYMITFQDPYLFDSQVGLSLSGYYYNRVFTQYTDSRVGGRIGLGYQFTPDLSGGIAYGGAKINISNPEDPFLPALAEVTGRDLAMHDFQISLTHDKRDNAFMATEGHLIQLSLEEVLGSFQYPKAEIDLRKYFTVHERPDGSGRHVLSLAAHAGFAGDNTPIYDRYYVGGYSSLRGFQFRGVSPTQIGPSTGVQIAVGGDFEMLVSAEYLFPITADDMLSGVVFCDTGTVEPTVNNWTNNYRVAPGFGLRIKVPAMGPAPIALDFAFPVAWQPGDIQQVFSFFVGFGR